MINKKATSIGAAVAGAAAIAALSPVSAFAEIMPATPEENPSSTEMVSHENRQADGTAESVERAQQAADAASAAKEAADTQVQQASQAADAAKKAAEENRAATEEVAGTVEADTQNLKNDSETAAGNAEEDAKSAEEAARAAESASEDADKQAAEDAAAADEAKKAADAADAAAPTQEEVDAAKATDDANQAAADTAKANADAAKSTLDEANQNLNDATDAKKAADTAATDAQNEVDSTKSTYDAAQQAYDNATTPEQQASDQALADARDAAKSEIDAKAATRDTAKADKDAADKAVSDATGAVSGAQTALDNAKTNASAKQGAVDTAQNNVDSAQAAYDTAKSAADAVDLNGLTNAVKDAQSAYDALSGTTAKLTPEQALDNGSKSTDPNPITYKDIFDKAQNYSIDEIVTNPDGTTTRVPRPMPYPVNNSALSYEKLLNACDLMDAVNAVRKAAGKSELVVSPSAIILETVEADINDDWYKTHRSLVHSPIDTNGARCLAIADSPLQAVDLWMGEKAIYDNYIAQHPDQAIKGITPGGTMSISDFYFKNQMLYAKVGHYLNIMDPDVFSQAAGVGNRSYAWGGNFGYFDDGMTVAQWRQTLIDARDGKVSPEKVAAYQRLVAAKQALANGQATVNNANAKKAALASAQQALTQANQELDAAKAAVTSAQNNLDAAKGQLAQAQTAATQAASALTDAQSAYDTAKSAYDTANKNYNDATASRRAIINARDAAKTAYEAAQTKLTRALADQKTATDTLTVATAKAAKAQSDYQTAKDAYDAATAKAAASRDAYNKLAGPRATANAFIKAAQTAKAAADQSTADAAAAKQAVIAARNAVPGARARALRLRTAADKLQALDTEAILASPDSLDTYINDADLTDYTDQLKAIKAEAVRHADLAGAQANLDQLSEKANTVFYAAVTAYEDALDVFNRAARNLFECQVAYAVAHPNEQTVIDTTLVKPETKAAASKTTSDKTTTKTTNEFKDIQTGDTTNPVVPAGLAMLGGAMVLSGALRRRRRDQD